LAVAQRVLTLVVAAAVAFAPLGAAAASGRMHSQTAAMASQPASLAGHAGAHQHGALAKANVGNAAHSPMPCCPSEHAKSDCAQLCLQKCFSSLAVMPTATRAAG